MVQSIDPAEEARRAVHVLPALRPPAAFGAGPWSLLLLATLGAYGVLAAHGWPRLAAWLGLAPLPAMFLVAGVRARRAGRARLARLLADGRLARATVTSRQQVRTSLGGDLGDARATLVTYRFVAEVDGRPETVVLKQNALLGDAGATVEALHPGDVVAVRYLPGDWAHTVFERDVQALLGRRGLPVPASTFS